MCSDECKAEWDKTISKKKLWLVAYIAAAVVMVVVLMLSLGGG
jgi:predicted nucleic acid-binding Zn ribbon protein